MDPLYRNNNGIYTNLEACRVHGWARKAHG